MTYRAVLVENEPLQAEHTARELGAAGFTVALFPNVAEFEAAVEAGVVGADVELFVLDRKLGVPGTSSESTDVGDELRETVLARFPDSLVVVLSGYTSEDHRAESLRGRGQLSSHRGHPKFDRVEVFRKLDLPEAAAYFMRVADWLRLVDDVALDVRGNVELKEPEGRLLRKLALDMGGVAIEASFLTGGLTDDLVFSCQVFDAHHVVSGRVLAKISSKDRGAVPSGLMATLPLGMFASRTATVEGVCGGRKLYVSQLAFGDNVHSLLADASSSTADIRTLVEGMKSATSSRDAYERFEDLIAPLVTWDEAVGSATVLDIHLPSPNAWFPIHKGYQHGDFHAGNVLIVNGSPVVIDFDSQTEGSVLLDPLLLILGTYFHRHSPLRESSITGGELELILRGEAEPSDPFLRDAALWLASLNPPAKEMWGVILGIVLRYARFSDVRDHESTFLRVRHLARTAETEIAQ